MKTGRMVKILRNSVIMCICLVISLSSVRNVYAKDEIGFEEKNALTICFEYNETPIEGCVFKAYRVASMNAEGEFVLTGECKDAAVDFDKEEREEWDVLASTLKGIAQAEGWEIDYSIVTDKNGQARLENIEPGIYLVFGEKCVQKEYTYWSLPALVALPGINTDHTWNHNVSMYPKVDRTNNPTEPEDETVYRRVIKSWVDSGEIDKRPEYVEVHLLCDGVVYTTARLTAAGDWRYEWKDLPKYDKNGSLIEWTVVEEKVESYTVKVSNVETTFLMVNTDTGVKGNPPDDPPVLPNTGLLWWPVSVLSVVGLICLIIGFLRRKSECSER